jgi:hypothetical protein
VDVTITGIVCFRLTQAKIDADIPRTQRLVAKLITITFGAAVPPTLAVILATVLTLTIVRDFPHFIWPDAHVIIVHSIAGERV